MLASLYGAGPRPCGSGIHQQYIKRVGNGLPIEERSLTDQVIESVCWSGASFVVVGQWLSKLLALAGRELFDGRPIIDEFPEHWRRRKCETMAARPSTLTIAARCT